MIPEIVEVLLTSKSEADIEQIMGYYESFGSSPLPFRDALMNAIAHLRAYPETATRRRDLTRRDVFFWLVSPYWLILRRTEDAFFVVSVIHCSRQLGLTIHERLKDVNG